MLHSLQYCNGPIIHDKAEIMPLGLHWVAGGVRTFTRLSILHSQALPVDGVVFAVAGAFSAASVMILIRRIGLGEVDWRVTLLYQVKQ